MPSSLPSTSSSPPPTAADRLGGGLAPRRRASAAPAGRPRGRTARAPRPRPRRPARRLGGGAGEHRRAAHAGVGHGAAVATASSITPSRAPWRRLPVIRPRGSAARRRSRGRTGRPARPGGMPWSRLPRGRQPAERGVDLGDGEARLGGRLGQRAERAPADADAPLGQHPGQVGDDDPDLGRVAAREEVGQRLGLGGARPGGGDRARGGDDLGERDVHPLHPAPPHRQRGHPLPRQLVRVARPATGGDGRTDTRSDDTPGGTVDGSGDVGGPGIHALDLVRSTLGATPTNPPDDERPRRRGRRRARRPVPSHDSTALYDAPAR